MLLLVPLEFSLQKKRKVPFPTSPIQFHNQVTPLALSSGHILGKWHDVLSQNVSLEESFVLSTNPQKVQYLSQECF